jgi:glutamate-1-semialdehyde aminotransferase
MKEALQQRQQRLIGQGCLTNSKHPDRFIKGVYPTHCERGMGCFVLGDDQNLYNDFICSLGASLLGHGNEFIIRAVRDQLEKGILYSLPDPLESEVAEMLTEFFPFVEQFKFLKTGTGACNAAVRMARAYTRRSRVLSAGYHGWGDIFTSLTPPASGVYGEFHVEPYRLDKVDETVAAVIVEPVVLDTGTQRRDELERLRSRCTRTGTILIFDEIITALRTPKYSISNWWKIKPDLILLGKAMAGGMPLSAIGGSKDILSGDYFVSTTFAGECLSLAACKGVLTALTRDSKYKVDSLWHSGSYFLREFNSIDPEVIAIEGYNTRGVLSGTPSAKALFMQEACKAHMLFGPSWFLCFGHNHYFDQVLASCRGIISRIAGGEVKSEGPPPTSPISAKKRTGG